MESENTINSFSEKLISELILLERNFQDNFSSLVRTKVLTGSIKNNEKFCSKRKEMNAGSFEGYFNENESNYTKDIQKFN